jgi:hypothetical protein
METEPTTLEIDDIEIGTTSELVEEEPDGEERS